jgi:hypothetical protein
MHNVCCVFLKSAALFFTIAITFYLFKSLPRNYFLKIRNKILLKNEFANLHPPNIADTADLYIESLLNEFIQ